jgi:hypothetical protein
MQSNFNLRKCRFLALGLTILSLSLITGIVQGYSAGPLDAKAGDPPGFATCQECHNSFPLNSGNGIVSLGTFPTTYTPNATYTIYVTGTQISQSRWGFELTAILANGNRGGILTPLNPIWEQKSTGSGNNRDYLKHTSAGTFVGFPTSAWNFSWQAPGVGSGPVTFYYCINAANNNQNNQGDYIYSRDSISVEGGTGVTPESPIQPTSPVLVSAYPNPFNPDVTLNLQNLPVGDAKVDVVDLTGRTIYTGEVFSFGQRNVELRLNLEDAPSGLYIAHVTYPGGQQAIPITKVK